MFLTVSDSTLIMHELTMLDKTQRIKMVKKLSIFKNLYPSHPSLQTSAEQKIIFKQTNIDLCEKKIQHRA